MPSSPDVTVLIPTRDRAHLLSDALACALGQEDVSVEVIVVDDGSSDETPHLLRGLDERRLRVFRHETPLGVARARNRGIAEARGAWIAFLDDDDLWSPRKLRTQLDAAAEEDASFVYASGVVVDERMNVVRTVFAPDPSGLADRLISWNVIGGPSTSVLETTVLRRLGGFDERLAVLADWDLWIRAARTSKAAACGEVLVAYLKHTGSMQVTHSDRLPEEFDHLARKHRPLRQERGLDFDYLVFWRWVALERLRAGHKLEAARLFLRGAVAYRSIGNVIRAAGTPFGETAMERVRAMFASDSLSRPPWLPPVPATRSTDSGPNRDQA
jgi:glycosyltransferase involved in cell wall biosynthesis